jgi:hypothetical protein
MSATREDPNRRAVGLRGGRVGAHASSAIGVSDHA